MQPRGRDGAARALQPEAPRADQYEVHDDPGTGRFPTPGAIARRAVPNLLEATIVPAALFYVVLVHAGAGAAMLATLAWSGAVLLRRMVHGERVPSLLVLSLAGLALRTAVGVATGSASLYFVQPVVNATAMGLLFLGSLAAGRPLVASLAADFCPLSPDVAARPGVVRLFGRLTLLWAGVHLLTAAATLGLLVSLPLATFVAVKTLACLAITAAGAALTVSWARRTARAEGLVPAPAGDGVSLAAAPSAA